MADQKAQALEWKAKGNEFLKAKDFAQAIDAYTKVRCPPACITPRSRTVLVVLSSLYRMARVLWALHGSHNSTAADVPAMC